MGNYSLFNNPLEGMQISNPLEEQKVSASGGNPLKSMMGGEGGLQAGGGSGGDLTMKAAQTGNPYAIAAAAVLDMVGNNIANKNMMKRATADANINRDNATARAYERLLLSAQQLRNPARR